MIKIDNISKSFDNKSVLKNLTCQIEESTIYGIIGVNGAGKSTLLRIINGIYLQDSGSVLIDGNTINDNENLKQDIKMGVWIKIANGFNTTPAKLLTEFEKTFLNN